MKYFILFTFFIFSTIAPKAQQRNKRWKKKATTVKPVSQTSITKAPRITELRLCDGTFPQPAWFLSLPTNLQFPKGFPIPSFFRVVTTIDTSWKSFLHTIPYVQSKQKIILPLLLDKTMQCQEFIIERTETMDSVLQAKYPELMSFRAYTANNSLNAARIECDANTTKMMITYNNEVYYVTSIVSNKKTYFICYAQSDANVVKENFEKK